MSTLILVQIIKRTVKKNKVEMNLSLECLDIKKRAKFDKTTTATATPQQEVSSYGEARIRRRMLGGLHRVAQTYRSDATRRCAGGFF